MSRSYDIDHSADAAKEAIRAIIARIQGEFDNPALVARGPLTTDTLADVLAIAEEAANTSDFDDDDSDG